MVVFVYPIISSNQESCSIVFMKIGTIIYSFTDSSKINELLTIEDIVVYFGGHSVLRLLFKFGFLEELTYLDLQHYFWNQNTNLTEISLCDCWDKYLLSSFSKKETNSQKETNILSSSELENIIYSINLKSYSLLSSNKQTNSQDVCFYEASSVFLVMKKMYNYIKNIDSYANFIDNKLCKSLIKLEELGTNLDLKYLSTLRNEINNELTKILSSIYFISQKKFNINSQREFNYILKDMGILNNKISKIELANNYNQTGVLLFKYIDQYRKLNVCYEQYVKPLYEQAVKHGYGRFKYNACKVPCLTRGHFCFEKSKGIVDISQIEKEDFIWTEYGFKKVTRADRYVTKNLICVEFSNGLSVIGTKHHPILINDSSDKYGMHCIDRKWCSLEHLFIGDRVICPFNFSCIKIDTFKQVEQIALFVCNLINNSADLTQTDNSCLKLSSVRFSEKISFQKFKACCEFLGLKHLSFKQNDEFKVYDIVFYDINGLKYLINNFTNFLTDRIKSQIKTILENKTNLNEYNLCQQGYFNNDYEETIVTNIKELNSEEIVYDIEVEDVHQYNANCVINHNTGRIASLRAGKINNSEYANINIQSVPKSSIEGINIRKAFVPPDNCYWCCVDYKSQEMRLVSKLYDMPFINNVPLNSDIYTYIGSKFDIFNHLNISQESKRNAIKVICLGIVYGLTNFGIQSQLSKLGIDDKTIDFRKEFFKLFPELETGQIKTLQYAHAVNGIYTLSGRFREIEFTEFDRSNFFTRNNRIALNTVIQGSCGDIIRNVINNIETEIYPYYNKHGFRLLNTIHDEVNFYIPKDELLFNEVLSKITSIISTPIQERKDIQFGYSVYIGENWGSLKEFSFGG